MIKRRRNTAPMLVDTQGRTRKLESARGAWSEGQLQEFLYEHPDVLPVERIEPFFAPLVPLAREVRLESGRLDLLYANANGLLTLVECKLWKSEEARRSVVGQLLEYANDTSQLGFSELEAAVGRARNEPDFDLVQFMSEHVEDLDEVGFVDDVNRNLRLGRFLLLIVGDGIRERMEGIASYLQAHAYLNFTFSLVQMSLFNLPGQGILVQPNVLLQTLEVERAVVRLEGENLVTKAPEVASPARVAATAAQPPRRRTVSLQVYLEQLAETAPQVAANLAPFLDQATDLGLEIDFGSSAVILRHEPTGMNLGIFRANGAYDNKGAANIVGPHEEPIGLNYIKNLAGLFGGVLLQASSNPWHWAARNADGSRLMIHQILDKESDVLRLMEQTVNALEGVGER